MNAPVLTFAFICMPMYNNLFYISSIHLKDIGVFPMKKIFILLLLTVMLAPRICCAENTLPYVDFVLEQDWKLFFAENITPEDALAVKEFSNEITLKNGKKVSARDVTMKNYFIDLDTVLGLKPKQQKTAIMVNTLYAPRAGIIRVGTGADWWMDCYINGEKKLTTFPNGSAFYPINRCNYTFESTVKAGKNLVVLYVKSGDSSFGVAFGPQLIFPDDLTKNEYINLKYPPQIKVDCGPWLTLPASDSMTVNFTLGTSMPGGIEYREKGTEEWHSLWQYAGGQFRADTFFSYTLNRLKENTEYEYRVAFANVKTKQIIHTPVYTFKTFTEKPLNHSFFAVGDTQFRVMDRIGYVHDFFRNCNAGNATFFVTLGDVSNNFDDFRDEYMDAFLKPLSEENNHGQPYVPVRGNHEYRGFQSSYFMKYFDKSYTSFRLGEAFYIVLDTGEDKPFFCSVPEYMEKQKEWLEKVIDSPAFQTAKFRIVLSHGPPGILGGYMGQNLHSMAESLLNPKDPKYRTHLWLSGHTHIPFRRDGKTGKTMPEGKPFLPKGLEVPPAPYTLLVLEGPNRTGKELSCAFVEVLDNSLRVKTMRMDGSVFDEFSIDPDGNVTEPEAAKK